MKPFRHASRISRGSLGIAMSLTLMGCSLNPPATADALHQQYVAPPRSVTPRSTHQRIPVQQALVLDRHSGDAGTTAHDVVQSRRPDFLRVRPGSAPGGTPIGVYLDGIFLGGVESLGQVHASQLEAIYRITPENAAVHLGRRHAAGALYLQLRR